MIVISRFKEQLKNETNEQQLINDLTNENIKLNNQLEVLKDKFIRLTAEYENYRKRTVKEKQGIYNNACEDILIQLLPVLDNLERALTTKSDTDSLKTGIEMTIRIFNESLNKLGVEEVNYERFDPNVHEAIMVQNSNYLNSGDISTVYQKGYKRDNKLIRCAKVAVVNETSKSLIFLFIYVHILILMYIILI